MIDPNRGLEAEDLIRQDLDIAMNADIGVEERQRRISLFYEPYHRAIDDILDNTLDNALDADGEIAGGEIAGERIAGGEIVGVIAIHTFTPRLEGVRREWEAGLIYDVGRAEDVGCALFLLDFLRGEGFLCW